MTEIPDLAYRLQAQAERWQSLVLRQQQLGLQLRELANRQRELTQLWLAADMETEVLTEVGDIEEGLREMSSRLLRLTQATIDKVSGAVADAARELRLR